MKKRNQIIIIICVSVLLVVLFVIGILHLLDAYKDKHELDDLQEKNLLSLSIKSNNSDNHDEGIEINVDFEKRAVIWAIRKENNGKEEKEVVLSEEQCQELKDYIVDYSHKVKAKEKEYWPQTDEYPDMYMLFSYKVKYSVDEKNMEYRTSGALCYPDRWEEFIEKLMEY